LGVKATSAPAVFTFTNVVAAVAKGAFIGLGTGATNAIGASTGVLFSAGLFTAGDKSVSSGDTISASYQLSA